MGSEMCIRDRVLTVLVLTAIVFFVRDAASSPYEEPWNWGRRSPVDVARVSAATLIGDEARVSVPPEIYPLVADRQEVHVHRRSQGPLPNLDWEERFDAVVLDEMSMGWTQAEGRLFESRLILMDFRKRMDRDGVSLWIRRPGT